MSFVVVWCATNCRSSQININNDNCTSACGTIQDIKYPFRLAGDPTSCGLPDYQLSCVNNRTILLLNSNKSFLVLSINYTRLTIRLVDPGLEKINHNNFNSCSSPAAFPRYTLMEADVPKQYSYSIKTPVHYFMVGVNAHAIFIGCRNPAQSPLYVKMCSNNTTLSAYSHSYVLEGGGYELESMIGELENSCSITAVAWYSLSRTRRYRRTDEEEIGEALAWGFELFWFRFNCTTQHCISDNCFILTDHSGAFINCDYWTRCHYLFRWPPHLEFNLKCNRRQPLFSSSRALCGTPIPTMTLALHALGSNGLIPLRLSLLVTRLSTYETLDLGDLEVELAIPCDKPGKRVFEGFTVGFHLRKWEISCFYVPPSLLSGVALARTTQSGWSLVIGTLLPSDLLFLR
nr:rust resistance kinase Lr10-like [Ipomoea batatas]